MCGASPQRSRLPVLIHVKSAGRAPPLNTDDLKKGGSMPTETAIVVAAIVAVFAIYMAALMWADFYTRNYRPPH
jgi:hypothetical protein